MEKINWKVGDECYCEFKQQKIEKIEPDGRISSVGDGMFTTGAWDWTDHVFPAEKSVQEIAYYVDLKCNIKIQLMKFGGMNFPGISQKYRDAFDEMCRNRNNETALEVLKDKLMNWTDRVVEKINEIQKIEIDDVKLLK